MTLAELKIRALQKIKVLSVGEAITTDDDTLLDSIYSELYEYLRAKELVTWGSADTIPDSAAIAMVSLMAANCVDEFEINDPILLQRLMIAEDKAIESLQRLVHVEYVPTTDAVNY